MICGSSKVTGSQFYRFWNYRIGITLFPQYPNKLEMSITFFRWYRVFRFG